jgi:hypothetical protein
MDRQQLLEPKFETFKEGLRNYKFKVEALEMAYKWLKELGC